MIARAEPKKAKGWVKVTPVRGKERWEIERRYRKKAENRFFVNKVGDVISGRTQRIPDVKKIEALPRNMEELEGAIKKMEETGDALDRHYSYLGHGPKFLELYDIVLARLKIDPNRKLPTGDRKFMNKAYHPTPEIRARVQAVRKAIRADEEIPADTRKKAEFSLKTLEKQNNVGIIAQTLLADRAILMREVSNPTKIKKPEFQRLAAAYRDAAGTLPKEGQFTPNHLADLYLKAFGK